jgi:hypothetical protein
MMPLGYFGNDSRTALQKNKNGSFLAQKYYTNTTKESGQMVEMHS